MNRFIFLSLSLFIFSCDEIGNATLNVSRGLIINEFLASNDACCSDQNGDFDDWVEFYNDADNPYRFRRYVFTDTPGDDKPYKIRNNDPSSTTVPSKVILSYEL